ncbi:MAG: hypothetical protein RIT45_3838, partial [Pseudomonadota bacterium]
MTLRELLTQARRPALVVGNGVNLYGGSKNANSWSALLADLRKKYCGGLSEESAEAMSLPELYDALTIGAGASVDLQREFVGAMAEWAPTDAHRQIATWAAKNEAPILTTNFDGMFERSFPACKLQILTDRDVGFTRFYPWNVVSAPTTISDPLKGFGIWHLHGMERYPSSIRLGLTHYMG